MAVEVYRVMFVHQVAVNTKYIYNLAWILKCLKTLSISLVDDSAAATQPLSRHARVADAATQPLSHPARVADAATQPLSHSEWLSAECGWVAGVKMSAIGRSTVYVLNTFRCVCKMCWGYVLCVFFDMYCMCLNLSSEFVLWNSSWTKWLIESKELLLCILHPSTTIKGMWFRIPRVSRHG